MMFVFGHLYSTFQVNLFDISVTNSDLHGHVQTALDFILNAANRYPEIFIPPLPTFWNDQPNNSDDEREKLLQSEPYGNCNCDCKRICKFI